VDINDMNYSIEQSEITALTKDINRFAALVYLFADGLSDRQLFMAEIERFERIDWVEQNMFNQMFGYFALASAYCALKSKELDYTKAHYTNVYIYKEISYYHNVQYIVSRVTKEQWAALFKTVFQIYCRAYLCLANAYDHVGRFCEAQQYYHLAALNERNKKDVEINRGYSYANMHTFWEHEEPWIVRRAQKIFSLYPKDIDEKAPGLREMVCKWVAPSFDMPKINFASIPDSEYEKWVNINYIRINRYCDVDCYSELSMNDNVMLHQIHDTAERNELFASMYDEIMKSFINTRKLLYKTIFTQTDCDIEQLKMVYKNFYSILDKIALFIAVFLNLPIKPHAVDFSKIWTDTSGKNIRPEILAHECNLSLLALYNIKLDVYGSKMDGYIMDELTKDLQRIRNFIEHKFIKIDEGQMSYNDYQLTISKNELNIDTIRLAQLVRCAIIYLCNFVMHAEYDTKNNQ